MTEGKLKVSEGTIVNACKELANKVTPSIESIKEKLFLSEILHKDETGIKIGGKQRWLHTLTSGNFAFYVCHEKRGKIADDYMGVLAGYWGILMHDHLMGLYAWPCTHAECNAHLLRYLEGIIENEPEYAVCAKEMLELIVGAHNDRKEAIVRNEKDFSDEQIKTYSECYDNILERWDKVIEIELARIGESRKKKKDRYKREGEKLCPRLIQYKEQHLLFIKNFNVPFDNNLAERSLRGIKTKTKVSGGFRTHCGGEVYATIRSYIETLRRHKKSIHECVALAFADAPIIF
ncbi:transposase [Clostridia bacterium]|nr:transposase [Clostridia bacterium]